MRTRNLLTGVTETLQREKKNSRKKLPRSLSLDTKGWRKCYVERKLGDEVKEPDTPAPLELLLSYLFIWWLSRLLSYSPSCTSFGRIINSNIHKHHDTWRNVEWSECTVQDVSDVFGELEGKERREKLMSFCLTTRSARFSLSQHPC